MLDPELQSIERSWLLPLGKLAEVGRQTAQKFVIRPSRSTSTQDKFKRFQCEDFGVVTERITKILSDPAIVANIPRDTLRDNE